MSKSEPAPASSTKDRANPADRFSLENYQRPVLETPNGSRKILLHTCCAPCSAEVMDALVASKIATTVFFYNPNIHPHDEYELRKAENARYAEKLGMDFIDADYDAKNWFERVRGLEQEPERGKRCTACFDMRLENTAGYAATHGFNLFATTLGISRWKNLDQVNDSGARAAARFPDLEYWAFNWRKQGGSQRKIEITKAEQFYQQDYCGCVYSLRDANEWRKSKGLGKIHAKAESPGQGGVAGEGE